MDETLILTVDEDNSGERIDRYLSLQCSDISRSYL